jgi:hypothetical protein
MSKVVNLRQARKVQARKEARAVADANAARHGQTKAERQRAAQEAAKARAHLDGHKRSP